VLGDHLGVHRETARGDEDRFGPDGAGLDEPLPAHPDHGTFVDDQVGHARLVADLDAEFVGAFDQEVDDHGGAAQLTGYGTECPRGAGLAWSQNGHTFSLPVYDNPSVPGGTTTLPGRNSARTENPSPPTS